MSSNSSRKGIILAGGTGTRLAPLTLSISKQLMPVYDKPMIFYPLSTLMLAGIREILIITKPNDKDLFYNLLGDGKSFGIKIDYEVQPSPGGIGQALLIGSEFLQQSKVALALGDNLFHGNDFIQQLRKANSQSMGGTIFAYPVRNPEIYGVVEFNKTGKAIKIEEKPLNPSSKFAVTGLYFYDNSAVERVKDIRPSKRGEIEISTLNQMYLEEGLLNVEVMSRGMAWLDTGNFDSLQEAGSYIRTLEHRQGLKVGCPYEIAWRSGWITKEKLSDIANSLIKSGYGKYLLKLLET
tara:strand:+ start:628 stop:1512 length:885 start_codon:yes stop_codon:yes gene_type:complete